MMQRIRQVFDRPKSSVRRPSPTSISWCPSCGTQALSTCGACLGEFSPQQRELNIRRFTSRRDFADSEIRKLIGHLSYASPSARKDFRIALTSLLAEDFRAANSGKWTGDVALGLAAGHVFGSLFDP